VHPAPLVIELEDASKAVRLARLQREAWQDLYGRICIALESAEHNRRDARSTHTEILSAFVHATRGLSEARENETKAAASLTRLFAPAS